MTYMQRHLDYDFLINQSKVIYKKSASRLLTEMGILSVPYSINETLLAPIKHNCEFEGKTVTITYKPKAVMSNLISDIYLIQNNGDPYDDKDAKVGRMGGKGPQMYTPESIANQTDDSQEYTPIHADKEVGLQKLKAFSDLCVALANPQKLEAILPLAERKKDGSLAKNKAVIAWTGVSIQRNILIVSLKYVDEKNFEVKIERTGCNEKTYHSLMNKPIAADVLDHYK